MFQTLLHLMFPPIPEIVSRAAIPPAVQPKSSALPWRSRWMHGRRQGRHGRSGTEEEGGLVHAPNAKRTLQIITMIMEQLQLEDSALGSHILQVP
jgi:hypothetical protein